MCVIFKVFSISSFLIGLTYLLTTSTASFYWTVFSTLIRQNFGSQKFLPVLARTCVNLWFTQPDTFWKWNWCKYPYDYCTSRGTQAKERQLKYPKHGVVIFEQLWPLFCQSIWSKNMRPGPRGWVEQHHSHQREGSSPYIFIKLYFPSLGTTTFFSKQLQCIGLECQVMERHLSPICYCIISKSPLYSCISFTTSLPQRTT